MKVRLRFLAGVACLLGGGFAEADVLYVKHDAVGASNGSSWSNAFPSLQPAIDIASVSDQVWIAQGTYRPTSWPNGGTTEREKHFSLKNGVSVYGGFAGNETSLVERNPNAHPVILSGDLDGNDADQDGDGRSDPATTSNNAYHVFYHPSGLGLTNTTLIDGVTICGGNANGSSPHNVGGGVRNYRSSPTISNCTLADNWAAFGGGIHNYDSSPAIANCAIAGNSATNGGAIYNSSSPAVVSNCAIAGNRVSSLGGGIFNMRSSPIIANCALAGNSAVAGGGIYNYGIYDYDSETSPKITKCVIAGNSAHAAGGGIYSYRSSPTISNCTIMSNSASSGGGICNSVAYQEIANCTIAGNLATNGGGIYNFYTSYVSVANCTIVGNLTTNGGGIYNTVSALEIANSILWANTPNQQIANYGHACTASFCAIQNGYIGGSHIFDTDPLLLSLGDHGGPTPTAPVSLGSPCIDTGADDSRFPTNDQRGFPRDALPDIGACEFQALRLVSDASNPAAIGSQFTLRAISDIGGASFQWFGRESGDAWDTRGGGTNGLLTTPPLDLGLDLWVRVTGGGTNVDSAVQSIEVRGTYPEWVAFHGLAGGDADTGASPARDGIPNLIKYASGLDPNQNCSRDEYESFYHDGASNRFSLVWRESKTPTDLDWSFRKSTNLLDWAVITDSTNLAQSGTGYDLWEATVPADGPRLFLDVKVDLITP